MHTLNTNPFKKLSLVLSMAALMIFGSCVTQKDLEYLQDKDKLVKEFREAPIDDYKLKPSDELYIQISSQDEASASIFSTTSSQSSMTIAGMQPYGASLAAYTIDKEGYLLLPIIGNVYVKDKTTTQVSGILRDSLTSILNQAVVSVKLVNRYVSILGEVRNPGHFAYSQEKLSIFDALGLAGDITDFGNRSEVILTRNLDGKILRINLNLTKSGIIASEYYYLRPNDMVYVKPLKKRYWGVKEFPFSIILSTLSTALLIYSVIVK